MATISVRWAPEMVEKLRRELLEEKVTLQEIANREGLSRQRISQLVGRLDRRRPYPSNHLEVVQQLAMDGLSDQQISATTGLSAGYVANLRIKAGIHRPTTRKHTAKSIIENAQKWYERYGYTPAPADWNPSIAKRKGWTERARRFQEFRSEFGTPHYSTVLNFFGSWQAMISRANLPPVSHDYMAKDR